MLLSLNSAYTCIQVHCNIYTIYGGGWSLITQYVENIRLMSTAELQSSTFQDIPGSYEIDAEERKYMG